MVLRVYCSVCELLLDVPAFRPLLFVLVVAIIRMICCSAEGDLHNGKYQKWGEDWKKRIREISKSYKLHVRDLIHGVVACVTVS